MRFSKSKRLLTVDHDKENCSRSANRRPQLNQQHLQVLEETEKKLNERRQRCTERSTTRKYSPQPSTEELYATPAEKTERTLSLLFNVLDEKRLGYLSRNNLASYRLSAPVFQVVQQLLVHIAETTTGSHVTDYRQFRRLAISGKVDKELYEQLFMEPY